MTQKAGPQLGFNVRKLGKQFELDLFSYSYLWEATSMRPLFFGHYYNIHYGSVYRKPFNTCTGAPPTPTPSSK